MNREETLSSMGYPSHYQMCNSENDNRGCRLLQIPPQDHCSYGMMGSHSPSNSESEGKMKKKEGLRKGKWTVEEEKYTNKVIEVFNAGLLKLGDDEKGITLRAYLAEKLECDPMRITKKYTGASCLGKRVYHYDQAGINAEDAEKARIELDELEKSFHDKLEQMNRKRFCDSGSILENSKMISTPAIDALLQSNKVMQMSQMRMHNPAQTNNMMMKNMYPMGMIQHPGYPPHAYLPYPPHMFKDLGEQKQQYIRVPSPDEYYNNTPEFPYPYYIPRPPAAMMHGIYPGYVPNLNPIVHDFPSANVYGESHDRIDNKLDLIVPKVPEEIGSKSPVIAAAQDVSTTASALNEENKVFVKEEKEMDSEFVFPEPPMMSKSSFPKASYYNDNQYSCFEDAENSRSYPANKRFRSGSFSFDNHLIDIIPTASTSMLSADKNLATNSLIGIFTHLHKMSSKEDLVDFFEKNSPVTSSRGNGMNTMNMNHSGKSPIVSLRKSASNKLLSRVDSVESLCKLISPHLYGTNL